MRLATRVGAIAPSPTVAMDARAKEMRRQGVDVVAFGVGEPDFDTPEHVKEAGIAAIRAGFTKYTPVQGIPELREAIAAKLRRDNGLEYPPEQILVSSGAKESLYHAVMALCDAGDEVLIPAPYWVTYPEQVRLAGGVPVIVETTGEDGFKVTPDHLRRALSPRTRLLLLNSPSNPTGAVYSPEELANLADFCREHDLAVVSDEIYEKLVYEGRHASIAALPGMQERTVVVNGVSKSHAMTGWRIGYAAGPASVIKGMAALQSHSTTHPAACAQKAAVAALAGPEEPVTAMREEFARRRELMLDLLGRLTGVRVARPAGAFYVFPDVRAWLGRSFRGRPVEDDVALAELILTEARVALVPGTAFGAPGHLRLSYATSRERIEEGLRRLRAFAEELR